MLCPDKCQLLTGDPSAKDSGRRPYAANPMRTSTEPALAAMMQRGPSSDWRGPHNGAEKPPLGHNGKASLVHPTATCETLAACGLA